jgi:hypothetical protein
LKPIKTFIDDKIERLVAISGSGNLPGVFEVAFQTRSQTIRDDVLTVSDARAEIDQSRA